MKPISAIDAVSAGQISSCRGKLRFTYDEATRIAAKKRRVHKERVGAYRCTFDCRLESGARAWHVGHTGTFPRHLPKPEPFPQNDRLDQS